MQLTLTCAYCLRQRPRRTILAVALHLSNWNLRVAGCAAEERNALFCLPVEIPGSGSTKWRQSITVHYDAVQVPSNEVSIKSVTSVERALAVSAESMDLDSLH